MLYWTLMEIIIHGKCTNMCTYLFKYLQIPMLINVTQVKYLRHIYKYGSLEQVLLQLKKFWNSFINTLDNIPMYKEQKSMIPHTGKIIAHFDISTLRILPSMLAHIRSGFTFLLFKNILFINQLLLIFKIQLTISYHFKKSHYYIG